MRSSNPSLHPIARLWRAPGELFVRLHNTVMTKDYRYVRNEESYLPVAKIALINQFPSPEALQAFYEAIPTPERKNQFLRAASFYFYMVKKGDWIVDATDCNPIIDYFTNSYKAVGIFAIIESLSDEPYQDFHSWLQAKTDVTFPIANSAALKELHDGYKSTYGSIRRCVAFFGRLPTSRQAELCSSVEIDHKPVQNIKKLAEFLYNTRSKFVHEAEVILQLSGSTYHFGHKKPLHTKLTMPLFFSAFEEGLVAYFHEA